jgi:ubiquinone/menaquinone biosynthesis C-methylase UbiE
MSDTNQYLHGFNTKEQHRLQKQARFLEHQIYSELNLSSVSNLLEVGCGVGAQSEILLRRFPDLHLTGIDFSEEQIAEATTYLSGLPYATGRYQLQQTDATDMPFDSHRQFDGAFICWLLEHIPNPLRVLSEVRRVLKPGSQVIITEVLNSTFFVDPYSPNVWKYWMKYNDLQYDMKGDPFVGAKLGNMLQSQGFSRIEIKPRIIHLDNREPAKRTEMISFWTELLLSALPKLLESGYVDEELAENMKQEMHLVAKDPNAVFYYSFMQATAFTS